MKVRFWLARRLWIFLQIVASLCALVLTIPCIVFLIAALYIPRWDYTPSDTFHSLRRFFFRVFAGTRASARYVACISSGRHQHYR